jgi:sodium-dependent dicarboxylate transporter 2/3/5
MKRVFVLLVAAAILYGSYLLPETAGLPPIALRTIGLTVAFMVVLLGEALPLIVVCWGTVGIASIVGTTTAPGLAGALRGFSHPVLFFILGSFGLAAAFLTTPLSKRLLVALLRSFGKTIGGFVLALMLVVLFVTSFVSSVPTVALFMTIAVTFLGLYENDEDRMRTGKCLMIALPVVCLFGGIATPVGATMNVLAISMLYTQTGIVVSFPQWAAVGIPTALAIFPFAYWVLMKVYKPAPITPQMVEQFIIKMDVPKQFTVQEIKVVLITLCMFSLWMANAWYPRINIMQVTLLGTVVMFLPGIGVLEWGSFSKNLNMGPFFLVGTVMTLGYKMVDNGVSAWMTTFFPTGNLPLWMMVMFIVGVCLLVFIIMPVAPSVVVFMAAPVIMLAQQTGHSPAIAMMTLGMATGMCFLLPLDTIPLITFTQGYYKMLDMPKATIWIQIYLLFSMTVTITIMATIMGL